MQAKDVSFSDRWRGGQRKEKLELDIRKVVGRGASPVKSGGDQSPQGTLHSSVDGGGTRRGTIIIY